MVYSNWINVDFEADTVHNPDASIDTLSWSATISAPKLVDSILNRGTVKVYLNISSDPVNNPLITPLPVADISLLGLFITPYFGKQSIILIATDDAGSFTQNNVNYWQYRYVLIPGSVPGRMATINWNNYAEVKAYLGLKD